MKKCINGQYIEMTQEEIDEFNSSIDSSYNPTVEDRVVALESKQPVVSSVTLLASAWEGFASPYYQVVNVSGVTTNSMVELQPTPEQLASWQDDGFAFTALNDSGSVYVYVAGGKPVEDITVQTKVQGVTVV